jgi:hypothetical protein
MATPATPSNFFVTQGNRTVYLQWDLTAGATSYVIKKSSDGVNYSTLATITAPNYIDSAVLIGVEYFYTVAGINLSGTGIATAAQSVVPTPTGEMSLGQLRLISQQRADRVNSHFLTTPEWNSNIVQSCYELYDLLINTDQDLYLTNPITFVTNGATDTYPLPDGVLYNGAPPFYKLLGVDLSINSANNARVTVNKFNFIDRNRYIYPNTASTIYGVFNLQYRLMGPNLKLIPTPSASQPIMIWYIPRLKELLADTDLTSTSISGWIEYVVVDAAIKALQKEESDVSVLMMQKQALIKRIEESASNRDESRPDTISDVRRNFGYQDGSGFGQSGPMGGW